MLSPFLLIPLLLVISALFVYCAFLRKREEAQKEKKKSLTTKEALKHANVLADKSIVMLIRNIYALGPPVTEKEKRIIEEIGRKYNIPRPRL